jgi:two-component system CheB/CheR fusion protein
MPKGKARRRKTSTGAPTAGGGLDFPVVGVGASAGGLEALKELLRAMPPDSGLAMVVVQHLDPTHESQMANLLAAHTPLQVRPAEEGLPVAPDTVYTNVPGRYLTVRDGVLHLDPPPPDGAVRLPTDRFFRSLAEDRQEQAVCVVLSGSGSGGTLGVRAVRGAGGVAIAQHPETAGYDAMPRSAIATGLVDLVLPPREIASAILGYARRGPSSSASPAELAAPDALRGILNLLLRAGTDFRGYKQGTLLRRIKRRMGLAQAGKVRNTL